MREFPEFADLVKSEARALLEEVNADQRPIVERAIFDLASLTASSIANPAGAQGYANEARFPLSTLNSEAALLQLRAAKRIRAAIESALTKAAALALGAMA